MGSEARQRRIIIEKESRERAGIEGSERGERQQTEKG